MRLSLPKRRRRNATPNEPRNDEWVVDELALVPVTQPPTTEAQQQQEDQSLILPMTGSFTVQQQQSRMTDSIASTSNQDTGSLMNHSSSISGENVRITEVLDETIFTSFKNANQLVPHYDGKNMTVKEFMTDCESAYATVRPSERHLFIHFLKAKIEGDARVQLRSCTLPLTLEKIREVLERAYQPRKSVEILQAEMSLMKQGGRQETVLQFFNRVNGKLGDILDAMTRDGDGISAKERVSKFAVHCFIKGLWYKIGDPLFAKGPESMEEAIKIALKIEQYQEEKSLLYPQKRPEAANAEVIKTPAVAVNAIRRDNGPKNCRHCKSQDHLVSSCPTAPPCPECGNKGHGVKYCFKKHGKDHVLEMIRREKTERERSDPKDRGVPQGSATRSASETVAQPSTPSAGSIIISD